MNNNHVKCKVVVIGGGNSAHSLVPLLSNAGHEVRLLTRRSNKWSKTIKMEYHSPNGEIIDILSWDIIQGFG